MPLTASKIFVLHRAQWLVLVTLLVLFGLLLAYFVLDERSRTLDRERERLVVQARVIEDNLTQQLGGISSALLNMRPNTQASMQEAAANRERSFRLKALVEGMPAVRTMLMIDARGLVQASSRPEVLHFDASQRAYFRLATKAPQPELLYVSQPFISTKNILALNLVKAWLDAENRLIGISTATLDPEYFRVLLDSVRYAADMRATLIHGDGEAFLTVPEDRVIQGRQLNQPDSLFARHVAGGLPESVFVSKVPLTGDQRLVVYRSFDRSGLSLDKPILLAVSRSFDAVMAPWRQLTWVLCSIYAAVCGSALVGMYILRRKQDALEAQASVHAALAREQAERLEAALVGGDLGLIELEVLSGTRHINAKARDILGDGPHEPIDTQAQWFERMHPDDRAAAHAAREEHLHGQTEATAMDYRIRHRKGHWVWLHSRGRITERAADGTPLRIVGTYQDISARKAAETLIAELAFYDPLTKLANRRLLMDRLEHVLAASGRSGRPAALLFLDLDRFKWVNDNLGHDMGDVLLQHVAHRLQTSVRKSDTVARLGGDEFVLVLDQVGDTPPAARQHALITAEKIMAALCEPMQLGERSHQISCSVGITLFHGAAATPAQLLKQADQALYAAKLAGRNRAEVYEAKAAEPTP